MKKPWFGVNRFWGWYPLTWQGYTVILAMFVSIIYIMLAADSLSHSVSDTLLTTFPFICLITTSTMLTALITGKNPEFGSKNHSSKNYSPDNPQAYLLLASLSLPFGLYYFVNKGYVGSVIFILVFFLLYRIYLKLKSFE